MPKGKIYSDESLLTALQTHGTVQAAAESVGCSKRLIYSRMQDAGFRARLTAYRAERVRNTAALLDHASMQAVQCLLSILNDPDATPPDRIKAATAILEQSPRYEERLGNLEGAVYAAGHHTSPIFELDSYDVWKGYGDQLKDED